MAKKARVIYDFISESENELTVNVNEELFVIDDEQYDQWFLARNKYGNEGIVPKGYVEFIEDRSFSAPTPILPPLSSQQSFGWNSSQSFNNTTSNNNINNNNNVNNQFNDFNFTSAISSSTTTTTATSTNYNTTLSNFDLDQLDSFFGSSSNNNDSYSSNNNKDQVLSPTISTNDQLDDSDFDDDAPTQTYQTNQSYNNVLSPSSTTSTIHNNEDHTEMNRFNTMRSSISGPSGITGTGTIKHKPKNSFGLEAYLLVGPIKPIKESEKLSTIVLDNNGSAQWVRKSPPYTIKITSFSSENKYKGLKTYTAYTIQANIVNHSVNRRYKQFDWLHERLVDKYPNVCVPPLPDKAAIGRFEEEFIKKRQAQLELWLNRMSLHPVINQSEVFIHFLQCKETDTSKWKEGKRKHEKDEFRGAQWLCSINTPAYSCGTSAKIKEQVDKFSKAVLQMNTSVKNLMESVDNISRLHATNYKKDLTFMGKKFEEFGSCISNDSLSTPKDSSHNKLCEALVHTGVTYVDIANSYGEQAKQDASPLYDNLMLYRGILQQMPEIVSFDKNAIQIYDDLQQKPDKQLYNTGDIMNRLEVVNYTTLAEMNFFNNQKVHDFNGYMRTFLSKQIEFYSEITEKLKKAYSKYEAPPGSY